MKRKVVFVHLKYATPGFDNSKTTYLLTFNILRCKCNKMKLVFNRHVYCTEVQRPKTMQVQTT